MIGSVLKLATAMLVCCGSAAYGQEANWSGSHGSLHVGYDSFTGAGEWGGGIMGSAAFGYDFQAGKVVLGVEANFDLNSASSGFTAAQYGYGGSARLGVPVSSNMLIYGRLGYQATAYNTPSFSDTEEGVRAGFGGEVAFSPNFALRTEFNLYDYGDGIRNTQAKFGGVFRF